MFLSAFRGVLCGQVGECWMGCSECRGIAGSVLEGVRPHPVGMMAAVHLDHYLDL